MSVQMETDKEIPGKKSKHHFLWFLYVVVIPLLFVVTAALIFSMVSGVNVFNQAKSIGQKIPLVGGLFQNNGTTAKITEQDLIDLQGQVKARDAKITQLQAQLTKKNEDIQRKQLENNRLQQEISDLNLRQKQSRQQSQRALKDIVSTYETMSPKKAAPIIGKMTNTEALKILTSVKPETLASIMENMSAAQAAKYTELMTNKNGANQQSTP